MKFCLALCFTLVIAVLSANSAPSSDWQPELAKENRRGYNDNPAPKHGGDGNSNKGGDGNGDEKYGGHVDKQKGTNSNYDDQGFKKWDRRPNRDNENTKNSWEGTNSNYEDQGNKKPIWNRGQNRDNEYSKNPFGGFKDHVDTTWVRKPLEFFTKKVNLEKDLFGKFPPGLDKSAGDIWKPQGKFSGYGNQGQKEDWGHKGDYGKSGNPWDGTESGKSSDHGNKGQKGDWGQIGDYGKSGNLKEGLGHGPWFDKAKSLYH